MKKTVPGIEIPEGESCGFPDGRKCALFDWGLEGPAFCAGWGCVSLSGNSLKHSQCLALCGIVSEKPVLAGEKDFQNPKNPWEYTGKFSLEFVPNVPEEILAKVSGMSVEKRDDRIIILAFMGETGKISSSEGNIVINIGAGDRHWHYRNVRAVRDGEGKLIWRNEKYKKLSQPPVSQGHANLSQRLGLDRPPKNALPT